MKVLGIMNGTSIDGVDLVLTEVKKSPLSSRLISHTQFEFTPKLKSALVVAAQHRLKVDELARLHHELGRFYAETVMRVVKTKKWKFDLIGVHGQTVFHAPPDGTLQIGEMSYLRVATGKPVACDFRPMDMAVGGQGAPIATLFHKDILVPLAKKWLSKNKTVAKAVAVQNLGGIANVSYFEKTRTLSFDTGPANMLIDLCLQTETSGEKSYDRDGAIAKKGLPEPSLLAKWMKHPYFSKSPPKSCGREEFGEVFFNSALSEMRKLSLEDKVATLTEFTAMSLAHAYRHHLPRLPEIVVLCGGGALNPHLVSRLRYHLPECVFIKSDELGWPTQTIEGAAFAWLAAYRLWNRPSNITAATGAKAALPLGHLL